MKMCVLVLVINKFGVLVAQMSSTTVDILVVLGYDFRHLLPFKLMLPKVH
jgi:hypothetical protein